MRAWPRRRLAPLSLAILTNVIRVARSGLVLSTTTDFFAAIAASTAATHFSKVFSSSWDHRPALPLHSNHGR